ncbi:MAG: aminopeptidase [Bacilli bacterium]|nr:aminopeptidase [Bacilli bacterium]
MYGKNAWEKYDEAQLKEVMDLAEDYKKFITDAKIEREVVVESVKALEEAGYKPFAYGTKYAAGDKVYFVNKKKNVVAFKIGTAPITKGLRVLGAHIDSPRLDVKQNPLYESSNICFLDTHYYGGIKKYQWTATPLAIHGVVCKKDGTCVNVAIGEDDNDPIVGINELLIHLSATQLQKPGSNVVEGEDLDLTMGSRPTKKGEKDSVKETVLAILKEKYGMEEEDFLSAELEVVPAGKARDFGLDRSMVAGYGHDDKCCAYSSLRALLDIDETPEYTSCVALVDKEEVGSNGASGAHSRFFENCIAELVEATGEPLSRLKDALSNSYMLSSDVSACYDPLYAYTMETRNACYIGNGVVFNKYTGARGKSGCNDANAEMIGWIRRVMDDANVNFQTAELGKVDQGGGGTIAYILGNLNMNVIDAGMGVLNMHAPMEVISKADFYEAYKAYQAFLTAKF